MLTMLNPEVGLSCTYICHVSVALCNKMELYIVNPNLGAGMLEGVGVLAFFFSMCKKKKTFIMAVGIPKHPN